MRFDSLRILVADDNRQMRTIIGCVLTAVGVGKVHFAEDGKQALEIVQNHPVDIVFVDYEMPVMDGIEFIAATRRLSSEARFMPLIMVTGHSFGPSILAARDAGVNELLTKPVTAQSILQRLEAVIAHPRNFVRAPTFVGPDRRRKLNPHFAGLQRRRSDKPRDVIEL